MDRDSVRRTPSTDILDDSAADDIEATSVLYGGRYELLNLVGAGAFGSVYRARDTELEQTVALKVLRPEHLARPGALDRFRKEVRIARLVAHPNVARTFDIGQHAGERFLTMEFIEGRPLCDLCPLGIQSIDLLPVGIVLQIGEQICAGLGALHAAGIVHQDIKTDNILVESSGRVVITDFGIASVLGEPENQRDIASPIRGTPAYMAPEQVSGYGRIDTRTDIYAVGVLLYQMLTGRFPFAGRTAIELELARLANQPMDPRTFRPQLPHELSELLLRCLARDPAQRFPSAQELASALVAQGVPGPGLPAFLAKQPASRRGLAIAATQAALPKTQEQTADKPVPAVGAPAAAALLRESESRSKSVAVLVFRCEEGSVEDYLLLGLTAELIDQLSETHGLCVTSFGVVRGMPASVREPGVIGTHLKVNVVVDGSVQRRGEGLQVTVRLVDADSRLQFAVRRMECPDRNILALTPELAQIIGQLLTVDVAQNVGPLAENPAAVDLYLRARHLYHRLDPARILESVALFEQALALVPGDPTLLTGYAVALSRSWFFSQEQSAERAAEAAERAIAVAARRGESYLALAHVRLGQCNSAAAAASIRRALARSPRLAEAHEWAGTMLGESGPLHDALYHLNQALLLGPTTPSCRIALARLHALAGETEAAFSSLSPDDCDPGERRVLLIARARLIGWLRDRQRAADLLQNPHVSLEDAPLVQSKLQLVLLEKDVSQEDFLAAHAYMDRPSASPRSRAFSQQIRVEYLCLRREYEHALDPLASAVELGLYDLAWLDRCPLLQPLHELTAFAELRGLVARQAAAVRAAFGVVDKPSP